MTGDLKVLVVGGSGRVGRMLRRYWQAAPPCGITLSYQAREGGNIIWSAGNGPAALAAHGRFDRLLVLAGVTPGADADLGQNVVIARACHRAAAQTGAAHMLLASSSAVYGTTCPHPYRETDPPAPSSVYGTAKLEAEQAVQNGDGVPVCALRIGNVLGADALMANALRASSEHPLYLDRFMDGHGPLRSYIGPATLAQVLETLLHAGATLPKVLNIGAPTPIAMQALLDASSTPYVMRPAPPDAVQSMTLDCSALAARHRFDTNACKAYAMLQQWHQLKDASE